MTTDSGYEYHELFHNLWPLAPDEYKALEEHILKTGVVLDPIILWKGTKYIVDGHSRMSIAEKHGLPFKTTELEFENEEHVLAWMREHQVSRRNLRPDVRLYNMGLVHKYWTDKGNAAGESHVVAAPTKKTAVAFGVSEKTVQNAVKHAANVDSLSSNVKTKYLEGELSGTVDEVAKLASLPKPKQAQAAKLVASGQASTLSKAINQVSPPEPPKKPVSAKTVASKVKVSFSDLEIQRTFDAWKKMMAAMPQKIYRNVETHCAAIYKELVKYQEL